MPASASRKIVNRAAAPAPAPQPQPVQALLPRGVQLQALRVSSPTDPAEREAESTARKVVRMPVPDLAPAVAPAATGIARRAGTAGAARNGPPFVSPYLARFAGALPALARKVEGQPDTGANVAADLTGSLASGSPLPLGVRRFMEPRFNADFSRVRVHTGEQAARLNRQFSAQAFAVGNQIFFGRDRFKPETEEGRELIAHELTHTIQQGAVTQGAPVQRSVEPAAVTERGARRVQRLGISDALDYFADKAYNIPGFRMFTIVLGVNPINMSRAERSAANIMRAVVEFLPGGALITQALDNYGVFERAGAWVEQQIRSLGMTGSIIRDAIDRFLDSLSWRDIFNLGGVWDRARRIFTEPIDRIISFARGLIAGILRFVKDAILRPLAGLAQNTRGYDLLKAILGQDPITGDPYPRNADTLIGGFMKLIGQEEVWQNIKRANAVARAWAWFQGALAGLLGFVRSIPQLFLATLQSLGIADLVVLPRAFAKVAGFFIDVGGRFFSWAGQQVLSLLQIIFEVLAPGAMTYIRRAAGAFQTIIRDPIRFVGNLVRAGILGFRQFAGRFLTHLRTSLINWLTGTLSGANIYIPQAFTIREIIRFVLSVLGLTWQNIRQKIVRVVGEPAMRALETTFDIIVTLVTQGPAAAWEKIQEAIANLREMVMEQIMTFVSERIVQAAITRLLTSLNPAGAFIQAVIAIYNTVMFFVERLRQIAQVAMSFIDSMAAIAAGSLGAAANRVEQTMAGFLTLVISFLARLVGLGNVSQAITNIVNRIRQPIDRALDRVVEWIVAQARRLGRLVAQGVQRLLRREVRIGRAQHHLTLDTSVPRPQLRIESTPQLIEGFLVNWEPELIRRAPEVGKDAAWVRAQLGGIRAANTRLETATLAQNNADMNAAMESIRDQIRAIGTELRLGETISGAIPLLEARLVTDALRAIQAIGAVAGGAALAEIARAIQRDAFTQVVIAPGLFTEERYNQLDTVWRQHDQWERADAAARGPRPPRLTAAERNELNLLRQYRNLRGHTGVGLGVYLDRQNAVHKIAALNVTTPSEVTATTVTALTNAMRRGAQDRGFTVLPVTSIRSGRTEEHQEVLIAQYLAGQRLAVLGGAGTVGGVIGVPQDTICGTCVKDFSGGSLREMSPPAAGAPRPQSVAPPDAINQLIVAGVQLGRLLGRSID